MQGQLGLELVRECRPDVVLVDLHLPDLDGREVLEQLKADPATADIPVVVLSADATPSPGRAAAGGRSGRLPDEAAGRGAADGRAGGRRDGSDELAVHFRARRSSIRDHPQ
jgi:CheY-like chemotaxis protein